MNKIKILSNTTYCVRCKLELPSEYFTKECPSCREAFKEYDPTDAYRMIQTNVEYFINIDGNLIHVLIPRHYLESIQEGQIGDDGLFITMAEIQATTFPVPTKLRDLRRLKISY